MKTRALLIVGLLALSPASYGYGDALFHVLLKGAMEDKHMVKAAPEDRKVPEVVGPVATTGLPCTSSASLAMSRGITDPDVLNTMDHTCQ